MGRIIDMTGDRYGRLVVLRRDLSNHSKQAAWLCRCDCGNETTVVGYSLRVAGTKSCGCLSAELSAARLITHGLDDTPEHRVWSKMLGRCRNPNDNVYEHYGARGISVCERWSKFENFLADMGQRPSEDHSIEREDNDGNYEASNCVWATQSEQCRNRRSNQMVEFQGREMTLIEATEIAGLSYMGVWKRIFERGWPVARALTEPIRDNGYRG